MIFSESQDQGREQSSYPLNTTHHVSSSEVVKEECRQKAEKQDPSPESVLDVSANCLKIVSNPFGAQIRHDVEAL
jgi:hypothetical protein